MSSGPVVDVIKLIFGVNQIYPKLRNWIKFVTKYEPAQKWENYAIFKQNYTLELFIALKMAYCCCLG